MAISNDTMKAMVRDYRGIELSDEELELIRPEVDAPKIRRESSVCIPGRG